MQHIFLDFEMNPIPRENREAREIVLGEIIQIGAVKLNEDYQLTDRFSLNVKPEYSPVMPHITALTGIRQEDVENAPLLKEAIGIFTDWILKGATPATAKSASTPGATLTGSSFPASAASNTWRSRNVLTAGWTSSGSTPG